MGQPRDRDADAWMKIAERNAREVTRLRELIDRILDYSDYTHAQQKHYRAMAQEMID